MVQTRGQSSNQGEDGLPEAPPVPPSLADAIIALANAANAFAQNQGQRGERRGRNNGNQETTYVDFTDTRPPVFTKADEPLEADDWLRTMEQKFGLIHCTEIQKPQFAAQQLRGPASAWYANLLAAQPAGHQLTWAEFRTAFRAHYIPEGIMRMKLDQFLALRQGDSTVMEYVTKFNQLSLYAPEYVNTDGKKRSCFVRGLTTRSSAAYPTTATVPIMKLLTARSLLKKVTANFRERRRRRKLFSLAAKSARKSSTIPPTTTAHSTHSSR